MENCLGEDLASRMWEAMNGGGVPWAFLPSGDMKERMREAASEFLKMVGINPELGLAEFRQKFTIGDKT